MNNSIKTIGIVTGGRADYGLLSRTISLLQDDTRFISKVYACGTHLSSEFGYTLSELYEDKVTNIIPVEMLISSNSKLGMAKSLGLATMSFADVFSREGLDAILVLGDRYEIFAAAQAAMFLDVPIVHMHGGEVTTGVSDDVIRHCITKMATIHLPVSKEFSNRIKQLGEEKDRIFVIGSPGVDNIISTSLLTSKELENYLGFKLKSPIALVTYHPVSEVNENNIVPLTEAIFENPELTYIITPPNQDANSNLIIKQWKSLLHLSNVHMVPTLGFKRYLSVMSLAKCVIGNSSSGLIEAPSYNITTINIGTRQEGRPRASTVIDVAMEKENISKAIKNAYCAIKHSRGENFDTPYKGERVAESIVELLWSVDFSSYKNKVFQDVK